MSELDHFADDLWLAWQGESWQGPSLSELLDGVTAEQAARPAIRGAHSIWELVLHIIFWHNVVLRRMAGEVLDSNTIPDEQNFPRIAAADPQAWKRAVDELRDSSRRTADTIRRFDAARLDEIVPGKPYRFRHMLGGVAHHDAYHAGQIALLKKAL